MIQLTKPEATFLIATGELSVLRCRGRGSTIIQNGGNCTFEPVTIDAPDNYTRTAAVIPPRGTIFDIR